MDEAIHFVLLFGLRVYDLQVKVPLYGCDCYAYALLASGYVDLVIESGLKVCFIIYMLPYFGRYIQLCLQPFGPFGIHTCH